MTPALLLLRAALGDCGPGLGDAWDDIFGVVHQVGGAVLTAYGGGALVKPLTQLAQSAGLLPTPPSGKPAPPTPAPPAAAKVRPSMARAIAPAPLRPGAPSRAAATAAANSPAAAPRRHVKGATIAALAAGALLLWRLRK